MQVLNLGACFVALINQLCDLETRMVFLERCVNLEKLIPLEEDAERPEQEKSGKSGRRKWSFEADETQGSLEQEAGGAPESLLEFRGAYFRYRSDIKEVLRDLNLSLQEQQKIGIVGRTGAGKSSLTLAICKIIEMTRGEFCVGGVPASQMSNSRLRANISVIPQDPFIYEGTLRQNLDPYGQFSEEELRDSILQASLDQCTSLKDYLNSKVKLNLEKRQTGLIFFWTGRNEKKKP